MKLRIKQTSDEVFIVQRRRFFFFWTEVDGIYLERREWGCYVSEHNPFKYSTGCRNSCGMYYINKRVLHANTYEKALKLLKNYKESLRTHWWSHHKYRMSVNELYYNISHEVYTDGDLPRTLYYDMVSDSPQGLASKIADYKSEESLYKNKIVYNE